MANIFELVGMIAVENGDANKAIDETSSKARAFASSMKKGIQDAAKWGAGIAAAAAAATVAITNEIKKIVGDAAQQADTIDKMSQNMGLSTQAYQEWEHALNHCGLEIEKLHGGMDPLRKLFQSANDGTKEAVKAFEDLGFSAYDLEGDLLNDEQALERVIYALADMQDIARRNEIADMAFGGAYEEMLPLLNMGSEGIKALREEAHALGLVMSGEDVAAGVKYTDVIYDLSKSFQALKNDLGMMIIPELTELAEKLLEKIPAIKEKLSEWEPTIEATVSQIVDGLEWIIDNPEKVGDALTAIGGFFITLYAATHPVQAAIFAIGAGIIGLVEAFTGGSNETENFKKQMNDIDKTFAQTVEDIESEYTEANTLIGILGELESKTSLTEQEHAKWEETVKRLITLIPEFEGVISSETGTIEGGTQALKNRVTELKNVAIEEAKQKALQDRYNAVAEAYQSAASLEIDIQVKEKELEQLSARMTVINELLDEIGAASPFSEEGKRKAGLQTELKEAGEAYIKESGALRDMQNDYAQLLPEIEKAVNEYELMESALNDAFDKGAEHFLQAAEAMKEVSTIEPDLAENAEKELQEEFNDMDLTVSVTPVLSGRGYTFSGNSGARKNGGSYAFADSVLSGWLGRLPGHADGLNYVPRDNYVARLHKGEAVLTANEASAYRSGEGNARVEAAVNRLGEILNQVLSAIKEGQVIQLETGALVGQTAGAMNNQLGVLAARSGRRN